jgi:hypothetical protein
MEAIAHAARRSDDMTLTPASSVAILGFGPRAAAFAALLAPRGCALRAWDPRLADPGDLTMRARIEAAGVDAIAELSTALRGARLVVLDTVPATPLLAAQLQAGQRLLDLDRAPAADVDAVLMALGLPAEAARWEVVCMATACAMAHSTIATTDIAAVRRGELP